MLYEDETKCLVVSKVGQVPDLRALCVTRTFTDGDRGFDFEFPYKQFKSIILTSDAQYFIAYGYDKLKDTLFVYHAETGKHFITFKLNYFSGNIFFLGFCISCNCKNFFDSWVSPQINA